MPHQFASLNCQHCGENYCPVCDELCPKCGKDGIKSDEHRKRMKDWREADQKRKIAFENGLIDEIGSYEEVKEYLRTKYDFEPEICW